MDQDLRGFFQCYRKTGAGANPGRSSGRPQLDRLGVSRAEETEVAPIQRRERIESGMGAESVIAPSVDVRLTLPAGGRDVDDTHLPPAG
ncbi:MAG: hypothetical protein V4515_07135 [Chloroflexota bacterium]